MLRPVEMGSVSSWWIRRNKERWKVSTLLCVTDIDELLPRAPSRENVPRVRVVFILKITPGVPPSFFLKEVTAVTDTFVQIQTSKKFTRFFVTFFVWQEAGLSWFGQIDRRRP